MRQGALDAITRADDQLPDIEFRNPSPTARFDWLHRRDGGRDIYFISNQGLEAATASVVFRTAPTQPELWDAVTGRIRNLAAYNGTADGRTEIPLAFAPRQSWFVVLGKGNPHSGDKHPERRKNFPERKPVQELAGPWSVQFDPAWFYPVNRQQGPSAILFEKLEDWTQRTEEAIKYYSGRATYRKTFDLADPSPLTSLYLDLGVVKNVARVRLNGHDLGAVWTAPWQVEITNVLKSGANELEIEVANLWPNRLIGDASVPAQGAAPYRHERPHL
jgi:hypothetical protein